MAKSRVMEATAIRPFHRSATSVFKRQIDQRVSEDHMSERQMKTSEAVFVLGLYANDCCEEELIFDEGDTFWRCPRCQRLCRWELVCRITREADLEFAVV